MWQNSGNHEEKKEGSKEGTRVVKNIMRIWLTESIAWNSNRLTETREPVGDRARFSYALWLSSLVFLWDS